MEVLSVILCQLTFALAVNLQGQLDMPKFEVKKQEIAAEMRRLLSLEIDVDLKKIIKQLDVHEISRGFYISFKNTNKYLLGYSGRRKIGLVQTIGAQHYPSFSGCCLNIIVENMTLVAGYDYDPLKIIDLKKIRFEIQMALLDAITISDGI